MNSAGLHVPALLVQHQGERATPFQWKDINEPWNTKGLRASADRENQGCANMVAPLANRYADGAAATPAEGVLLVSTDECPPLVDIQIFWPKGARGIRE